MRWDPLLALATAHGLDAQLTGGRVRALLLDREARRILLYAREWTLAMELHPLQGWISRLPPQEPLPEARRLPARLRSVEAPPDESALVFHLQRIRGSGEGARLVVELWGNRWNGVLVGARTGIIRHVLLARETKSRTLAPGAEYAPLPPTGRELGPEALPPERWDILTADPGRFLKEVAYTSSLNLPRYLGAGGRERWLADRSPPSWTPGVAGPTGGAGGGVAGGQPYPVSLPGRPFSPTPTLLDAFQEARRGGAGDAAPGALPPVGALGLSTRLTEAARRLIREADGKARALTRELSTAPEPERIRMMGDLLLAHFHRVPRGRDEVVLPGFEGTEVRISLDPSLPPQENAQRYYREAGRAARAREALPTAIRQAEGTRDRWKELLGKVERGEESPERLSQALTRVLGEGWDGDPRATGGLTRRGTAAPLPYRTYRTTGGLEVRVGRGSRENDELTFRHSAPGDIWLHARHAQGAHVILRWPRGEENPPARDLQEAAGLAAHHSRARGSGSVPVDWTRRKHVRKPRKAPPGLVVPREVKTLFVEPDPALVERLRPGSAEDLNPEPPSPGSGIPGR